MMIAIVPLKSPERAKTRLAGMLGAAQRRQLLYLLAERVIRALQATRGIDAIVVVTASSEVAAFAAGLGAQTIMQSVETGTAGAFSTAVQALRAEQPDSLLMISGDLPLVSAAALQKLVDSRPVAPGVIVVPDRHDIGTNALLCTPPDALPPCFGNDSLRRHLSAAGDAGVGVQLLRDPALTLDLDLPADFEALRQICRASADALFGALQAVAAPAEPAIRAA